MALVNPICKGCDARVALIVMASLMLAGCVAPEQISEAHEKQCRSYGLQPTTTDFTACMTREDLAERSFDIYELPSQLSYPYRWY